MSQSLPTNYLQVCPLPVWTPRQSSLCEVRTLTLIKLAQGTRLTPVTYLLQAYECAWALPLASSQRGAFPQGRPSLRKQNVRQGCDTAVVSDAGAGT